MKKSTVWSVVGLLLLVNGSFTFLIDKLVRTQLYEGVTISMPRSFRPMSEALLQEKYLAARRPLAAYTDPDQQVAFGLNVSNTRWQEGDLAMLKDFYRASLLELYDEVNFLQETIKEIDGREFAAFEFVSIVRPDEDETSFINQKPIRQYTYVQYTVHRQKTWVLDFSVPARVQARWQEIAQQMMDSIKMK